MVAAWLVLLLSLPASAVPPDLTVAEQAWLAEHPTIRVSGPRAFPPFQYTTDQGGIEGMAADYLSAIAEMLDLTIEPAGDLPWPKVLEKIKNREIDLLACAGKTGARERYLLFTDPHLSFPLVIITRKDAPFVSGLESLHDKRVAMTRRVLTQDLLKEAGINASPKFATSPTEALRFVSLGRADATIQNLAAATYLIEENGFTNLKVAAPTSLDNYALSMAVRQDWPIFVSILNKSLASLPREKHNEIRQKWMSVRFEHGLRPMDILKWTLLVGGIALIIILVFFRVNRKLSREIQERRRVEKERVELIHQLQEALDEVRTLRGILPICAACKKIRDDDGYWNRIESYIAKHSEAEFSHSICPQCAHKLYPELEEFQKKKKEKEQKAAQAAGPAATRL